MDQNPLNKCDGGHRRHDMVLSITPKTTSLCTDQTPTPTRLIRKCEEVGLFQDLQNVNPFEETFRKAVEAVRTGSTPLQASNLSLPSNNADDTLHTPNLFPNVLDNELPCSRQSEIPLNDKDCATPEHVQLTCAEVNNSDLESKSSCNNLINVLETCTPGVDSQLTIENCTIKKQKTVQILLYTPIGNETINVLPVEVADSTSTSTNSTHATLHATQELQDGSQTYTHLSNSCISREEVPSVKNKLKQSLLKNSHCTKNQDDKNNNDGQVNTTSTPKLPIPPLSKTLILPTKRKLQPEPVENVSNSNEKKDKLEKNRESAMRCRAKRKRMMEEMQRRCSSLESVNVKLQSVISNLRAEIAQLQTLLLAHRNCPVTDAMVQEGIVEKSEKVITFSLPSVVPRGEKSQVPIEKSKLTIRMVDGPTDRGRISSSTTSSAGPSINTGQIEPVKSVLILPKGPPPTNCSALGSNKSVATNVIQVNPNITARNNVR